MLIPDNKCVSYERKQSWGGREKMAIGEIITCTGPEDLLRRAIDLQQKGIQTEFIARNTMKVVRVIKNNQ